MCCATEAGMAKVAAANMAACENLKPYSFAGVEVGRSVNERCGQDVAPA
jgi:hypothetical protein